MKFLIIRPDKVAVELVQCASMDGAYEQAGLPRLQVDHGFIANGPDGITVNIVVYEFGLRKPVEEGQYFSIFSSLYEGTAIIFAADRAGETISCEWTPDVMFYKNHIQVEKAIKRGAIIRPQMAVNNKVLWEWNK